MKISPINSTNTNFQSKIQTNKFFQEGIELIERSIKRSDNKSMNYVKDFYDSITNIKSSEKAKQVLFDIDMEAGKALVFEDGKKAKEFPVCQNFQQGYLAVETVKQYSKDLFLPRKSSLLDEYKLKVEIAKRQYQMASEVYKIHVTNAIENMLKTI